MIVRIRTAEGMKRVTVGDASASVHDLLQAVQDALHLPKKFRLLRGNAPLSDHEANLSDLGIKNGEILILETRQSKEDKVRAHEEKLRLEKLELDPVDTILSMKEGKVARSHDQFCRHAPGGRCVNCMPLDPYDPGLLKSYSPPIKFLSFHSYLRKLQDSGKFAFLEETNSLVRECFNHPPWPQGICSKCQPSAIHLKRQEYRHTDFVEIEDARVLDAFIDGWRKSGTQRVGFMYGVYAEYDQVPLGIKAVVKAIYEPKQLNEALGFEIDMESKELKKVDRIARELGLEKVGWVFTDLEANSRGQPRHKRYIDVDDPKSYVLSAEELLNAALLQQEHPNAVPLKFSPHGFHGSKFTTVVVSGNENNAIELKAYQATTQAMHLMRDDILRPSTIPAKVAVKPTSDVCYVPDVFYVEKDEYKNDVKRRAQPLFPIEYLMVDLPVAGRTESSDTLFDATISFPIENRLAIDGSAPTLADLGRAFEAKEGACFLERVKNFHMLLFLALDSQCSAIARDIVELLHAVRDNDVVAAEAFSASAHWATMTMLIEESKHMNAVPQLLGRDQGGAEQSWRCATCTLINLGSATRCSACLTPRSSSS